VAREGGGVPYTPNLVPQHVLPLGRGGLTPIELTAEAVQEQLFDLERFLEEEFQRLSIAMISSTVQAAYGALILANGPAPDQPTTEVPIGITGFDDFTPAVPNRITASTAAGVDSLVPEEGGIYQITGNIVATISSGRAYNIGLAINGTATDIFSTVDSSNQTNLITLIFHGLIALNPGDLCTLLVSSEAQASPHTFIMLSAIFSVIRVSERNDEPGLF